MQAHTSTVLLAAAVRATACGGDNTRSNAESPGSKAKVETKVLEAGAVALQDKPPIEAINAYLDGFHFYNGRMNEQMEVHHYCAILNEELIQCVITLRQRFAASASGADSDGSSSRFRLKAA